MYSWVRSLTISLRAVNLPVVRVLAASRGSRCKTFCPNLRQLATSLGGSVVMGVRHKLLYLGCHSGAQPHIGRPRVAGRPGCPCHPADSPCLATPAVHGLWSAVAARCLGADTADGAL